MELGDLPTHLAEQLGVTEGLGWIPVPEKSIYGCLGKLGSDWLVPCGLGLGCHAIPSHDMSSPICISSVPSIPVIPDPPVRGAPPAAVARRGADRPRDRAAHSPPAPFDPDGRGDRGVGGGLAQYYREAKIALLLNRQGRQTARGLRFTRDWAAALRRNWKIPCFRPQRRVGERDIVSMQVAAKQLGLAQSTLYRLLYEGSLAGEQLTPGAPWRIRMTQ